MADQSSGTAAIAAGSVGSGESARTPVNYSISIVSHRSGALVAHLLDDLRRIALEGSQIIITLNVPEDDSFLLSFGDLPITVVRNAAPKGFGENHNQAFGISVGRLFAVVNPDIRLRASPFAALQLAASDVGVGVAAPVVMSPRGTVEDSIRRFPTVWRLAQRVVFGRRLGDYATDVQTYVKVDWAAGMFLVFNRESFRRIGGFDTRYFMYLEDADICRRLWACGLSVLLVPGAQVVHDARRNSHRQLQHLKWHLRSAVRFLFGV